jgi:hypothetical protein
MPATSRFSLPYLSYGDAPDIPLDGKNSMEAVEAWLSRSRPYTSSTRPTGISIGFMIFETDTSQVMVYNGSTWVSVSPSTGGTATAYAKYESAANQSIPDETTTAVAFGTAVATSAAVTRSAFGAGHKFKLEIGGIWAVNGFVRYQAAAVTGERFAGFRRVSDESTIGGNGGAPPSGNPVTCSFAITEVFEEDEEIYVSAFQNTGTARIIEPFFDSGLTNVTFTWLRAA